MTLHRALLLASLCCVAGCGQGRPVLRRATRLMMDTYVTIQAFGPSRRADRAIELTFERLDSINRKFNHLDSTSPLFAFNHGTGPLLDSELVSVVKEALAVSEATGGAFDITVEPLVRLWGFYGESPAVPPSAAIDSCLGFVGYRYITVENGRVRKLRPEVAIDLGGVAKGHALAEAAKVLRAAGVDSAIVDIGGDVFAIGRKGNANWRIGIRAPRADSIIATLPVSNLAIVTSGDYERFFFAPPPSVPSGPGSIEPSAPADSVRYCHIIDPRTGWPARRAASSTVVMSDPALAQCWSKVLFILGPSALELLERRGIEALLVSAEGTVLTTAGFDRLKSGS